jgi:hypothetical protein
VTWGRDILVSFTVGKGIQLAAAACGAVGTFLLYRGSFTFESPGFWVDEALLQEINARNRCRQRLQRVGLAFLMLSFLLGALSLFFE